MASEYDPSTATVTIETDLGSAGDLSTLFNRVIDIAEREHLDQSRARRLELTCNHETFDGRPVGWHLLIEGRRLK